MPAYSVTSTAFRGLDVTSSPEAGLPPINKSGPSALRKADNVRLTVNGGVKTRAGVTKVASVGSGSAIDSIKYMPEFDIQFLKSGTKIYQSNDNWATSYEIGATRTASEQDFMYPLRNNMFATNGTDGVARIAVSTLYGAITGASVTITLRSGDAAVFPNSGTIYIEGDAIAYTGKSGDTLTGVTGIDASHAAGTVVTYVDTSLSGTLATCISELENRTLFAVGKTIYYSLPYLLSNPEYAYDITSAGAGSKSFSQTVKALCKSSGIVLIGLTKGIEYAYVFDVDTSELLTRTLSGVHGVPSARSIEDTDSGFVLWTGRRVLPVSAGGQGVNIQDNPDQVPTALQMDYPIRADLLDLDDDQSSSWIHYNPFDRELTVTCYKDYISKDYIYNYDVKAWVKDSTKAYKCKTNTTTRTYAGSDSSVSVFRDRYGALDNGVPIRSTIRTPIYTVNQGRATSDYLKATFAGVLSTVGQFTFRVYVNSIQQIEQTVTADDLVSAGLMVIDTSPSAGSGIAGAESLNPGAGLGLTYPFTYPFEFFLTGERLEFEWEVYDAAAQLEIRTLQLEAETENLFEAQNI